jgi:hypothetical protein
MLIQNTDTWLEQRDIGSVKELRTLNPPFKRAFFKPAQNRRPGAVVANEYIAFKLAQLLKIPAAEIQVHQFDGIDGYISHAIEDAEPWTSFPFRQEARDYLTDPTIFSKIFVFDFWIRHVDRHDGNIVFRRREDKYEIFLIDNEHCLCGADQPDPTPDFENFPEVFRIAEHRTLIRRDEVMDFANKVQGRDLSSTIKLIDEFAAHCPQHINANQVNFVKDFITRRASMIQSEIKKLYESGAL